jgi:hypothetical protein
METQFKNIHSAKEATKQNENLKTYIMSCHAKVTQHLTNDKLLKAILKNN